MLKPYRQQSLNELAFLKNPNEKTQKPAVIRNQYPAVIKAALDGLRQHRQDSDGDLGDELDAILGE